MTPGQRFDVKQAADNLQETAISIDSSATGVTIAMIPSPHGSLGTDGSCWTDKEISIYVKSITRLVNEILKYQ